MAREKDFDAVKMMREVRDKLSREVMNMTYDEQRRYLDEHLIRRAGSREREHREETSTV
jgi:hypothetical protein